MSKEKENIETVPITSDYIYYICYIRLHIYTYIYIYIEHQIAIFKCVCVYCIFV